MLVRPRLRVERKPVRPQRFFLRRSCLDCNLDCPILLAMQDSVFTKIIKGEIPSHKIYEDDKTLAFLDIHPQQPGQTVVVPKTQVNFVWDLGEDDYRALMSTVQK